MTDEVQSVPIRHEKNTPVKDKHFVKHVAAVAYEADETDLLPTLKKPKPVEVTLADANELRVKPKKTGTRVFHASAKPKIFFSGNVTVTDVPDEEEEPAAAVAEVVVPVTPKKPKKASTVKKAPAKKLGERKLTVVDHSADETPVAVEHAAKLKNPHGIIGMQRTRISNRNPMGGTLKMEAREVVAISAPRTFLPVAIILVALVAGFGAAAALVGFEVQITHMSGVMSESVNYSLDGLGASVRSALGR